MKVFFASEHCKSRNDIAEVKAVCNWYWPSIKSPEYLTEDPQDDRILKAVEYANKYWNNELDKMKQEGRVYEKPGDVSDTYEILGMSHKLSLLFI